MSWIILILAGLMEVAGVTGMSLISRVKISGWLTLLIGFNQSRSTQHGNGNNTARRFVRSMDGIGTVGSALISIIFIKSLQVIKELCIYR